jgi:putative FmdB family regulatory protein
MPVYEYQCPDCEVRFELLRPAREAPLDQPCPTCDADSKRVMSRQWSAFVFRDGRPRQLPDDGGYWHLGQKVSKPITGAVEGIQHPEVNKQAPPKAMSIEELEKYEYQKEQHTEHMISTGVNPVDQRSSQEVKELNRRMRMPGSKRLETVKRRVARNVRQLEYKKRTAK